MSLAAVETQVLLAVVEALEECDQAPSQAFRHHGAPPVRCCTDEGILSIHWEQAVASSDFPGSAEGAPVVCASIPAVTLVVRWLICWPVEPLKPNAPVMDYAARDAAAARLATVADCVLRALVALGCAGPNGALWPWTHNRVRIGRVTPLRPQGGCAGNEWRIVVGVLHFDDPT